MVPMFCLNGRKMYWSILQLIKPSKLNYFGQQNVIDFINLRNVGIPDKLFKVMLFNFVKFVVNIIYIILARTF